MKITNKIFILSLIFFLILYTVCRIFFKDNFTIGVSCGYLLSALNLFMLERKVKSALEGKLLNLVILNSQIRLLGTGALIWAAYTYLEASMIGVLVGLSVVPLSIPPAVILDSARKKTD